MIGIDEVGRGAWAGPLLVVAARVKKSKSLPVGLTDSKVLNKKRRETLAVKVVESCDIGQGWVSADMIDELGLSQALRSATLLALMQLDARVDESIIIDGNINFARESSYKNTSVAVKADLNEPIVSAASIVAKVLRDNFMAEQAVDFPGYGFEKHVGYGTAGHAEKIKELGICKIHRKTFKPIRQLL